VARTHGFENEEEVLSAPGLVHRSLRWCQARWEQLVGFAAMVVGLAILSVIPILNFIAFGYLLESSARVARSGRLRDAMTGVRAAAGVGTSVICIWLLLFPLRFVISVWRDAALVAQGSGVERAWRFAVYILALLTVLHLGWALIRGGRIRHFLWPAPIRLFRWLSTFNPPPDLKPRCLELWRSLRLSHYFLLGIRGFVGALAFLILPVLLLIIGGKVASAGGVLLSLLGATLLFPAVLYLPFLQTRFAIENRFGALFEVGEVRRLFRRAPVAFWLGLLVTVLFSLPLYLLKVELPPRELAWLPAIVFVLFILPARILVGWAFSRALKRDEDRHGFFRFLFRMALLPVVGFYILFLYLTQYLSWNGSLSLLEQHAFMVPAPLLGI